MAGGATVRLAMVAFVMAAAWPGAAGADVNVSAPGGVVTITGDGDDENISVRVKDLTNGLRSYVVEMNGPGDMTVTAPCTQPAAHFTQCDLTGAPTEVHASLGGGADNLIKLNRSVFANGDEPDFNLTADLGDGDDAVSLLREGNDSVTGGPGVDSVTWGCFSPDACVTGGVTVDLAAGSGTDPVSEFENASASGTTFTASGTDGPNHLVSLGPAVLTGRGGADGLEGSEAADTLDGGPGGDTLAGHGGDDTLLAADGTQDIVDCGEGNDQAVVDPIDITIDCEESVVITAGPSGVVNASTARFEFRASSANPPPGRFECALNGGTFTPCASPLDLTGLTDGDQRFQVRYHQDGEDPGRATERRWTVATGCPDVQVGFATAKGCFIETAPGSRLFETTEKAWVGGFEIQAHDGGKLVLNTLDRRVSAQGAVDVVFEGTRLPIPVGALPVSVPSASFELNQVGTVEKVLVDLPMKGTAKVAWTEGGKSATFEAALEIEKLTSPVGRLVTLSPGERVEDLSGKLKASLTNGAGFQINSAEVGIAKLDVLPRGLNGGRVLGLRNILLRFERREGRAFWTGQAGISFPMTRGDLTVTGKVFVFDGALAGGGLAVDGINRPIGATPLFLQRVSGDLLFSPRFGYGFGVGATLGPLVRGVKLFKIDGDMKGGVLATDCTGGPFPTSMTYVGSVPPLGSVGQAKVTGRSCWFTGTDPALELTAQVKISFLDDAIGYDASQTGFVSTNGANLEGRAQVHMPGPDLAGQAIVSTNGLAACGSIGFAQAGFGYRWGNLAPAPFSGCDLAPFRATVSSAALRARTAAVLQIPGGLPHAAFAATAASGAPRLKVTGPGGFSLTSPVDGGTLRNGKAYVVSDPEGRTTYVIVNDPRAGAWHVDSADPARPLTRVRVAPGLPKPRITARVRKTETGARLTYRLKSLPGQSVSFTERGPGIAHRLGRARGRRGSITFKPSLTTSRKRTIEAEVTQNGLPRARLTVARFKAPAQPKLTRPRVKATRTKATLTARWAGVVGAASYLVEVRTATGTLLGPMLTSKRRVSLRRPPAQGTLTVTVQALSGAQKSGPVTRKTVKAPRRR